MFTHEAVCAPCDATVYTRAFASLGELANYVDRPDTYEAPRTSYRSAQESYDRTLTHDIKEAVQMARYGWYGGRAALVEALEGEVPALIPGARTIETTQNRFDVEGDEFDVGRYTTGVPEYMSREQQTPVQTPGRHLTIYFEAGSRLSQTGESSTNIGLIPAAVALAADNLGIRTKVIATYCTFGLQTSVTKPRRTELDYYTTVKDYDEPLDLAKLAFAACHPSLQRRLFFAAKEREADHIQRAIGSGPYWTPGGGYGKLRKTTIDHIPQGIGPYTGIKIVPAKLNKRNRKEYLDYLIGRVNEFYLAKPADERDM